MIKYFTIKNFRSIKNENILEFDAHLENSTYPAHPVIGFAGANASGKTNVLRSLTFVSVSYTHLTLPTKRIV